MNSSWDTMCGRPNGAFAVCWKQNRLWRCVLHKIMLSHYAVDKFPLREPRQPGTARARHASVCLTRPQPLVHFYPFRVRCGPRTGRRSCGIGRTRPLVITIATTDNGNVESWELGIAYRGLHDLPRGTSSTCLPSLTYKAPVMSHQ